MAAAELQQMAQIGKVARPPFDEQDVMKKDSEKVGAVDQGLNKQHKIDKGSEWSAEKHASQLEPVEGDRVYIKFDKDIMDDMPSVTNLMRYLDEQVAAPHNLLFSDYSMDGNEISFKVSSAPFAYEQQAEGHLLIEPVVDVADNVYKRRSDVPFVDGAHVVETGVGNHDAHLPVSKSDGGDRLSTSVGSVVGSLCLMALVITVLCAAIKYVRSNGGFRCPNGPQAFKNCTEVVKVRCGSKGSPNMDLEKGGGPPLPPGPAFEELRQHRKSKGSVNCGEDSHKERKDSERSFTMDMKTGHEILEYLESYLSDVHKLEIEWKKLECQEYDNSQNEIDYVKLCDANPETPLYIVPKKVTTDIWQQVWQNDSAVIVNLCSLGENAAHYWPENEIMKYGNLEVQAVSEQIWCEDYLVRTFQLRDTSADAHSGRAVKTVAQYHFVNWLPVERAHGNTLPTAKALMDFRRKVRKACRAAHAPVMVHCNGGDRAGTYCLIDLTLHRLAKGSKEINMAATLEHLREQFGHSADSKLVATKEQYEFALAAVAEDIQAMAKENM